jgi:hypothetical protein
MTDARLNDEGHRKAHARSDILAAAAIAQFYNFAGRCLDWANTTRSLQERALYRQMALQWLAAGARLQTFAQFTNPGVSQRGPPTEASASNRFNLLVSDQCPGHPNGELHDATDE